MTSILSTGKDTEGITLIELAYFIKLCARKEVCRENFTPPSTGRDTKILESFHADCMVLCSLIPTDGLNIS